jgi:2TM domain
MSDYGERAEADARARAVARLKKKSEFRDHFLAYLVVNGAIVAIWIVTGAHFFWPIIPMVVWGIGLIFHARDVYGHKEISETDIRQEIERMRSNR